MDISTFLRIQMPFKAYKTLMLLLAFSAAFAAKGNGQTGPYDDIFVALKSGNADALMIYVGGNLKLSFEGWGDAKGGTLSKKAAHQRVERFFNNVKPYRFNFVHEGQANEWLKYQIGYLLTAKGKFRTMLRVRESGGAYVIQELEFIKE